MCIIPWEDAKKYPKYRQNPKYSGGKGMKKKLAAIIFTALMMLSLALPALAVSATADKGTPVIDGVIDEVWSRTQSFPVDQLKDGSDTGLKAEFKMLWDESYLYFLLVVTDSDIAYDAIDTYKKDGTQLYFDFTNEFAASYGEIYGGEYTFYLRDGEDELPTLSEMNAEVSQDDILNDIVYAHKLTDKGYVLEARFNPKLNYSEFKLAAGTEFAFEVQVNDQKSDSLERVAAYGWSDNANIAWQTPSVLGSMKLVETPVAEPEAPAAEEPAVEVTDAAPVVTAPATADMSVIALALAAVTLAGSMMVLKKKK